MTTSVYRGVVRSTADPANSGRIRVQVPQVTGTALSGWVAPAQSGGAAPIVGQQVWVLYEGADISYPVFLPPMPAIPAPPISLVQDWTTVALASGFTTNGNSNGDPAYRVLDILGSRMVEWQGGINITYSSGVIANSGSFLASALSFLPSSRRTVPGSCSVTSSTVNSLKFDFQTDGTAAIVGTNTTTINPPWVSLNGVSYYL